METQRPHAHLSSEQHLAAKSIANRSDRPRKNLANNSAGTHTIQPDQLVVAQADERLRFRGAAYIVARVRGLARNKAVYGSAVCFRLARRQSRKETKKETDLH